MTSQHHSWPRGPLEAALWEFRGKEKQWTVEKASLRREADAQRRQAGKLQHQLDKLQVLQCNSVIHLSVMHVSCEVCHLPLLKWCILHHATCLQCILSQVLHRSCAEHTGAPSPQSFQEISTFPGTPVGLAWVQVVQGLAHAVSRDVSKGAETTVLKHQPSLFTMLAGTAQVYHAGAVQCEGGLEEA